MQYFISLQPDNIMQLLLSVVLIVCGVVFTFLAFRMIVLVMTYRQKRVFVSMTPSIHAPLSQDAVQELLSTLHGLRDTRPLLLKICMVQTSITVQVTASKHDGVRYVYGAYDRDLDNLLRALKAFSPDAKYVAQEKERVIRPTTSASRYFAFRQKGHFAYPFRITETGKHDSKAAYLANALADLQDGETATLQLVLTPVVSREAIILQRRLLHNEQLVTQLGSRRTILGVFGGIIIRVLFGIVDIIGDIAHGPSHTNGGYQTEMQRREVAAKRKPARSLSTLEQELATAVHDKLQRPLFAVAIRGHVTSETMRDAKQRMQGIRQALLSLRFGSYQSLVTRVVISPSLLRYAFARHLPALIRPVVLSNAEVAAIVQPPDTDAALSAGVEQSLSKMLPVPLSLKRSPVLDIVIGENTYHGTKTPIGLTAAEREKHMYIIGGTGNGKTTMMEYAIVQDIRAGRGVAVLDPHGDLAEKLLGYIPEERIKDVIYFNPADLGHPIGINILELPKGLSRDELLNAKDFVTESVISIMRKTFSDDDTGGHRIEYILRNAIQTALTVEGATLFTVFDLLTDGKYLKRIVRNLEDVKLKNFWKNEFGKAGDYQRVKMAAGVTAKIGRYQFSASAERILSQPESTIDFGEILDGKILICNLAKGLVGEDTSALFGVTMLAKIQLAAYERVRVGREDRKPFYVYVDEFQNFATMSFVQLLSEARKYKVFMTMAEQSTSQQKEQRMVQTILANVGTVICFRSGNPADELLLLPMFKPFLQEGDIANLPQYTFYARLAAVHSQEPTSGTTVLVKEKPNVNFARQVVLASRKKYASNPVRSNPLKQKTHQLTREVKQGPSDD